MLFVHRLLLTFCLLRARAARCTRSLLGWLGACCALLGAMAVPAAHAQIQLKIGGSTPAAVSDTVTTPRVTAQLVALAPEGIAAGAPFTLGLRITHQPDWHTYWKNAGDSGLPTQLDWQLPAGITAGEIDWPVPQQIRVGDLLNYGYEGTVLLPVPATVQPAFAADADGHTTLRLHASWLVCRVECIPEEGDFALRLPVAEAQALDTADFATAHDRAPTALASAQAELHTLPAGNRVQLRVQGLPAAAHGQTLAFYPELAETFVHAAVLGQDWTQAWDGSTWTAELPLSNLRGPAPERLAVVLGLTDDPHTAPSHAWRVHVAVRSPWQAASTATVSPALSAALAANQAAADQAAALPARTASNTGWVAALLGGLIGGLLLNLMPCVFPVLAIKLLALSRHGGDVRAQRASGWAYAAGVVVSFVALGAVLLALRAAGEQLGWGFQLQSPIVVALLAVLFTLIGLNLAGVFELGHVVPDRVANLHARHPLADAFVSGVVAVAIASPCTAPFMGASLGFAIDLPAAQALGIFAALGVGMALPYVLVSWVPGLLRWLPRPGAWMHTFRRAMAFPMWATVVWLVWVLGQQTGIDGAATLLLLLLCVAALVWALTLRGVARGAWAALALLALAWLLVSLGRQMAAPPSTPTAAASDWQPWSASAQQAALDQGHPVFVDYTAAWCVTCQFNKRNTLADPVVLDAMAQRRVTLLRADWTRRDPAITAALAQLGRSGVPVYVLQAPGQAPIVLSELLRRADVLQALQQL